MNIIFCHQEQTKRNFLFLRGVAESDSNATRTVIPKQVRNDGARHTGCFATSGLSTTSTIPAPQGCYARRFSTSQLRKVMVKCVRRFFAYAQNDEYCKTHVCPQNQPNCHTEALAEVSNKQNSNQRFFGRILPQNDKQICHPELVSGSQAKRPTKRFRTKFGMTSASQQRFFGRTLPQNDDITAFALNRAPLRSRPQLEQTQNDWLLHIQCNIKSWSFCNNCT